MFGAFKKTYEEDSQPKLDILGLAMSFMAKDRDGFAQRILPFFTPELIGKLSESIVGYFNEQQRKRGEDASLRIAIGGNEDRTDVLLRVYEYDANNKGEAIFERYATRLTVDELKPIIDAILDAMFAEKH